MSKVGIVGAGRLGSVLAARLAAEGHAVGIANSRGPQTLCELARRTGAEAASIPEVAAGVEVLIIAIPLAQVARLPASLIEALPPQATVIDTGNYVPGRDGRVAAIEDGMPETAWVAERLGVPVKALNNITDDSLARNGRPSGTRGRVALPVSGDDPGRRATAMRLIDTLGFDAFDAGTLAQSWRQQIGQAAYCTDPDRAQLRRLLERADPRSVSRKREGAMRIAAKMPDDFPKADLTRVARLMAGLDRAKVANWLSLARLAKTMLVTRTSNTSPASGGPSMTLRDASRPEANMDVHAGHGARGG